MRLPWRVGWVIAFHAAVWAGVISAANSPPMTPAFIWVIGAAAVGVAVVLQGASALGVAFHAVALFVTLPGTALLIPMAYAPNYVTLATSAHHATVTSAVNQERTAGSSLPRLRSYLYSQFDARTSTGLAIEGVARGRVLRRGDNVVVHIDPLDLVTPQTATTSEPTWLRVTAGGFALLAEVEVGSALIRRDGKSFIADSGREETTDRQEPAA